MEKIPKNILCFAPHPDDEILGCGGSLIKAIKQGHRVSICYLTYGEQGGPKYLPNELAKVRKQESLSVCHFLGIKRKQIYFLEVADNNISSHDLPILKQIISLIRSVKPDLVYLPHEGENYHDHREASLLIQRALGMSGSANFPESGASVWWVENVLGYEVSTPMQRHQYSEDISDVIEDKVAALKLYTSQTKAGGNVSDFIGDKARYLSGYRAAMTIGEYREFFQVFHVGHVI